MKGLVAAKSKIDTSFKMFVLYSEHEKYASDFAPIFKSHGLGFLMPGKKEIYIDGEAFKGLSYDHLLAIQAHEIAHYRLKHRGTYSKKQELEADVEGHKILVDGNYTKAASILRKRIKDHYGQRGLKMLDENKENNMIKLKDILKEGGSRNIGYAKFLVSLQKLIGNIAPDAWGDKSQIDPTSVKRIHNSLKKKYGTDYAKYNALLKTQKGPFGDWYL